MEVGAWYAALDGARAEPDAREIAGQGDDAAADIGREDTAGKRRALADDVEGGDAARGQCAVAESADGERLDTRIGRISDADLRAVIDVLRHAEGRHGAR